MDPASTAVDIKTPASSYMVTGNNIPIEPVRGEVIGVGSSIIYIWIGSEPNETHDVCYLYMYMAIK